MCHVSCVFISSTKMVGESKLKEAHFEGILLHLKSWGNLSETLSLAKILRPAMIKKSQSTNSCFMAFPVFEHRIEITSILLTCFD
jgi:hypothetical protein